MLNMQMFLGETTRLVLITIPSWEARWEGRSVAENVLSVIGGLLALLSFSASNMLGALSQYTAGIERGLTEMAGPLTALSQSLGEALRAIKGGDIIGFLGNLLRLAADAAGNALFSLALVVFLLLESDRIASLFATDLRKVPVVCDLQHAAATAVKYFQIRIQLNAITVVNEALVHRHASNRIQFYGSEGMPP